MRTVRRQEIDPITGRYIQSDPIGFDGGVNTYVYVGANPVVMVDESGLWCGGPIMQRALGNTCYTPPKTIDSTYEAVVYYYRGNGEPIELGEETKRIIRNHPKIIKQTLAIKNNTAKHRNGNLNIDLQSYIFHVGNTGVVFNTKCETFICTITYTAFVEAKKGSSQIIGADSFSDPFDIGIESPGGTPYDYKPYTWKIVFPYVDGFR